MSDSRDYPIRNTRNLDYYFHPRAGSTHTNRTTKLIMKAPGGILCPHSQTRGTAHKINKTVVIDCKEPACIYPSSGRRVIQTIK